MYICHKYSVVLYEQFEVQKIVWSNTPLQGELPKQSPATFYLSIQFKKYNTSFYFKFIANYIIKQAF